MTKLYHGTSAAALDSIKAKGIEPRGVSKIKSNWTHTIESNKDAVYLTDAYAWHFAANADEGTKGKGLILEVDRSLLLPWKLCPDEDYLEQGSRKLPPGMKLPPNFAPLEWSMKKRTRYYRKLACANPQLADNSLKGLGTVGYYATVPWMAVTRYVTIDWMKMNPRWFMQAVDSMVSIINYSILQERHRAFTSWLFGDPVTARDMCGYGEGTSIDDETDPAKWPKIITDQIERTDEALQDRSGLDVVTVKEKKAA